MLTANHIPRPDWDVYFMGFASQAATRSTCPLRSVGAVLVSERRIITTGYNGALAGHPHCTDPGVGCLIEDGRCIRVIHAEQNTILQAAMYGISTRDCTLYTTCRPCHACARMIAGCGIRRVIYIGEEFEGWNREVLDRSRVELIGINYL